MKLFLQLLLNGIVNGAMFGLLAVSFGFVYRTTKIFHIAFAGIFTSSCYILYTFLIILKFPVLISVFLSAIFTGFLGFLLEKGVYLQFFKREASEGVILIASLGCYIFLENGIAALFGNETKVLISGILPTYSIGKLILTKIQAIQLIVGILIILFLTFSLKKFKFFKIFWAIGDEPNLVSSLGIPLLKFRSILFFSTSFLLSIPACLISLDIGTDPHQGMHYFLISVVAVLFGGIDSFSGWWIGGFLLAILQSLIILKFSASLTDLATFAILILVLLFRPQGIFGTKKRMEEV